MTTAIEFHSTLSHKFRCIWSFARFLRHEKKVSEKHRFIFQPVSPFIRSPMEPMTIGFMSWTEVNRMKWTLWSHCRAKGGGDGELTQRYFSSNFVVLLKLISKKFTRFNYCFLNAPLVLQELLFFCINENCN